MWHELLAKEFSYFTQWTLTSWTVFWKVLYMCNGHDDKNSFNYMVITLEAWWTEWFCIDIHQTSFFSHHSIFFWVMMGRPAVSLAAAIFKGTIISLCDERLKSTFRWKQTHFFFPPPLLSYESSEPSPRIKGRPSSPGQVRRHPSVCYVTTRHPLSSLSPLSIPPGACLFVLLLSCCLFSHRPFIPVIVPLLFNRVPIHILFIWLTPTNRLTSGRNESFLKSRRLYPVWGLLLAAFRVLFFFVSPPNDGALAGGASWNRCKPKREALRSQSKVNEAGYSLVCGFYGGL